MQELQEILKQLTKEEAEHKDRMLELAKEKGGIISLEQGADMYGNEESHCASFAYKQEQK